MIEGNMTGVDPSDQLYVRLMRGIVVENKDPKGLGRVRVRIPSIHQLSSGGIQDKELPWAYPVFPNAAYNSGNYMVPEVNSTVLIGFENGDKDLPLYVACFYGTGHKDPKQLVWKMDGGLSRKAQASKKEVPRDVRNLDTRVLYRSPKGHRIVFRDDDGKECAIFADCLGQGFSCESHLTKGAVTRLEKLNDSDDGTEGRQADLSGNTPVDDQKQALTSDDAVVMMKGVSGSAVKITSSKSSSKVEIVSEGNEKATILMESGVMSSIKLQAGMKPSLFEMSLSSSGFEVKGPLSKIKMNQAGQILLDGVDISINGVNLSCRTTNATMTGTLISLIAGIVAIVDKSPSAYMPMPNMIKPYIKKFPELNTKSTVEKALEDKALANASELLKGMSAPNIPSTGVSGVNSKAQSVSDGLSQSAGKIADFPTDSTLSREAIQGVANRANSVIESSQNVQNLGSTALAGGPPLDKLSGIINFANTIPGSPASVFTTESPVSQLADSLRQFGSIASPAIATDLLQLETAIRDPYSVAEFRESLRAIDNVRDFVGYYRGILMQYQTEVHGLVELCDSFRSYVEMWQGRIHDAALALEFGVASSCADFKPSRDELNEIQETLNVLEQLEGTLNEMAKIIAGSVGKLLVELRGWAQFSPTLMGLLNDLYEKVLGQTFQDLKVLIGLKTTLEQHEDPNVKAQLEKIIIKAEESLGQFAPVIEAVINGRDLYEAIFEEDVASGAVSEAYKTALLSSLTIDITGAIEEEIHSGNGSVDEFLTILSALGWKATTD